MSTQPKKKNLFKFFKSKDFNDARILMCAIYILLSHVNEMTESVNRLMQGYEGVLIGKLKHKAKLCTQAFDEYVKEYEFHIDGGLGCLADATIKTTSEIDVAVQQNKFFLQEGYKAIHRTIQEQMENTIRDDEQIKKEQFAGFEIFDPESRKDTLEETLKRTRMIHKNDPNLENILYGVKIGFNTACDYVNEVYLKS